MNCKEESVQWKEVVYSKKSVLDLIDIIINLDFQEVWCLSLGGRQKHSMDTFKGETSIFVQTKLIIRDFCGQLAGPGWGKKK